MTVIPIIISAGSFILALCVAVTAWINQGKDRVSAENRANEQIRENQVRFDIKLDNIIRICNETSSDIKALDSKLQGIDKRVTILERDQKTLWNQVDKLIANSTVHKDSKGV